MQIEVVWYSRHISGGEQRRTFSLWEPPAGAKPFTFNSTEPRAISVPVEEVKPVRRPASEFGTACKLAAQGSTGRSQLSAWYPACCA